MSYVNTFFDGMRSAFDFAPTQKIHKANFITQSKTPTVNISIDKIKDANAWTTVGSYMKKAEKSYELKHPEVTLVENK